MFIKNNFKSLCLFLGAISLFATISNTKVSAITVDINSDVEKMTIEELVKYGEEKGLKITLPNNGYVDKKELSDAIIAISSLPNTVNLDEWDKINTVTENTNIVNSKALTEYISANHIQTNNYRTVLSGNYDCTIQISIRYDMLVDRATNTKTLYEVKAITSNSVVAPVTAAGYTQLDGWVDRKSSNSAYIKGQGVYSWSLISGAGITRVLDFSTTFYM